jgi:hypothetical protein
MSGVHLVSTGSAHGSGMSHLGSASNLPALAPQASGPGGGAGTTAGAGPVAPLLAP